MNPSTGELFVSQTLDADLGVTQHVIIVKVSDNGQNPSPLSATATLTFSIEDVNEYYPNFSQTFYFNTSIENESIGSTVLTFNVQDQDAESNFTFA